MKKKTNRREFFHTAGLAAGMMAAAGPGPATAAAEPQARPAPKTMGARFRELLQKREPFHNLAVYDVMSARLVENLGFPSVFIGSSAVAESFGVPDWSVVTDAERIAFAGQIAKRINIPSLVDIDEGGFSALSLYRSVKRYEEEGIAAVHITDAKDALGRTVGVLPLNEMVDRIHAAVDARKDMVISLRACGFMVEGKEKTIERALAYAEAGAETVWFIGMPIEQNAQAAEVVKIPLTGQMFFDTPFSRAKESRITVATYASFLQNFAQGAVYDGLMELKNTGALTKSSRGQRLGQIVPNEIRSKMIETEEYTEKGKKFHQG
jgi:2-methylisocitrate lyase-like PEP mutase family enzyme